jgi:hypothetical protein
VVVSIGSIFPNRGVWLYKGYCCILVVTSIMRLKKLELIYEFRETRIKICFGVQFCFLDLVPLCNFFFGFGLSKWMTKHHL